MSEERETLLNVSGMTCGGCVRHVERALRGIDGVREVDVRFREGKVVVRHDAQRALVTSMIEALREAGYEGSATA